VKKVKGGGLKICKDVLRTGITGPGQNLILGVGGIKVSNPFCLYFALFLPLFDLLLPLF
jgi:hypothetical protein